MTRTRTLAIVKCRAVERHLGSILAAIHGDEALTVVAEKHRRLSRAEASMLYAEHEGRAYFEGLIGSVTDGYVHLLVLEGESAVAAWRGRLGATDPAKADEGSLRRTYGGILPHNGFHGSDSDESAAREIALLFPEIGRR